MNVSNLNPIKKGKYFLTFLLTVNSLFNEFTIVCIKVRLFIHSNGFFKIISIAICTSDSRFKFEEFSPLLYELLRNNIVII